MTETIDRKLNKRYMKLHDSAGWMRGFSVLQHEAELVGLFQKLRIRTMLDYGSGGGKPYEEGLAERLGVQATLYDPAVRAISSKPQGKFDAVVCSDVLEHVPERLIEAVIGDLFAHARRIVFASVCCRPAKKVFPEDGTNLHVTVRPFDWWDGKFRARQSVPYVLSETA